MKYVTRIPWRGAGNSAIRARLLPRSSAQPRVHALARFEPPGGEGGRAVGNRFRPLLDRAGHALGGQERELLDARLVVERDDVLVAPGQGAFSQFVEELGHVDDHERWPQPNALVGQDLEGL